MRTRTVVHLTLTETEEKTLPMWAGAGKTEQRMAQRAKVILLSVAGLSLPEISRKTGLSTQNASKWRIRFMERRLEGLRDAPRSGKPPVISPEKRLKVLEIATRTPPDGSTRWSEAKLARETGLSKATVHRILTEGALKPHRDEYWCGRSPDPEFEEKQAAILGLYLTPPENALVLSVDEKTQIQALDRQPPGLPHPHGKGRRLTATYKRNGTTCLLAALSVHEGTVTAKTIDSNNHEAFLGFLKRLYRENPGRHLHVIVDNLSVHKHRNVREWMEKRRRLTLHFTPTYASWLNQIEIWFNIFSRDVLKGGVWKSKKELVDQILMYIKKYNAERARPFQWTYTGKPLTL
jgi:transposase